MLMNQSCYTRLTLIMWLILMSVSFSPGAFAQKREIKTLDELLEVLRPMAYQTKSDSVGIVGDVLIAEDGISVDRSIPVAVKASLKGGPLYRAADYEGAILDIGPDGDLTLANTIDGKNVPASQTIVIEAGGRLELADGAKIVNVMKAKRADYVISNSGSFEMTSADAVVDVADANMEQLDIISGDVFNAEGAKSSLYKGTIGGGLLNYGDLSLYGGFDIRDIWIKATHMLISGGVNDGQAASQVASITIESRLQQDINISGFSPLIVASGFRHGDIIAKGGANYRLTANDADHLLVSGSWEKRVMDNTIVLIDPEQETGGVISNERDLQTAINNAKEGGTKPTELVISESGFDLTGSITIPKGKRVLLTGGTIKRAAEQERFCMFIVDGGFLTLRDITLDGNRQSYDYPQSSSIVWVHNSGYLEMGEGAVLRNNTDGSDTTDKIGTVNVWDGTFVMNGGTIRDNYGFHSIIEIGQEGEFRMVDGLITANAGGGIIYNMGNLNLYGGRIIENTNVRNALIINGNGNPEMNTGRLHMCNDMVINNPKCTIGGIVSYTNDFILEGNAFILEDKITLHNDAYIMLQSQLSQFDAGGLRISHQCDANFQLANGQVVAQGGKYSEDILSKITYEGDFQLAADESKIYLSNGGATTGIRTRAELQAAINEAATGSLSEPTELRIAVAGMDMDQMVTIKGKHIKLTGNGVRYLNVVEDVNNRMFSVEDGGSLTIESAFLEGLAGSSKYCTFVYVSSGSSLSLKNVTMKGALSDLQNWSMLRVYGNCTLSNCTITNNNGKAMIFVGSTGQCRIEGGKITGNSCSDSKMTSTLIYNLGALDYVSGEFTGNHAISISSNGTTVLRSPRIKNYLSTLIQDEGSAIWVYSRLDLYGTASVGDAFYLGKSGSNYGCLYLHGALKNTVELVCHDVRDGWVAVQGADYALTSSDLNKITLAKALAEEYKLVKEENKFVLRSLKGKTYNVKTEKCENGMITADKATAAEGEDITVTVTPASGYKLYAEQLRYNRVWPLQPTNKTNVFTFKMPARDVSISAEFIPDDVTVSPVDTTGFTPDDVTPGTGIGNLDSLIIILGGGGVKPEASPVPEEDLPGNLADEVGDATDNGDEYVGSLEELIGILSPGSSDAQSVYVLPVKVAIVFYLPKTLTKADGLRASTEEKYYILNECEGTVTRIVPEYDADAHALFFKTDRMGVFTVMRGGGSSTPNERISSGVVKAVAGNDQLLLYNLPVGETYRIYDIAGRLVDMGVGNGSIVRVELPEAGVYLIKWKQESLKVMMR